MDKLYNRLKSLCDERGISLAKMCSEVGIPKSTPTELKMGRTKCLSTPSAQKIAAYFGITVDELLGNEKQGGTNVCTLYERITELCKKRGVKGGKMCTELGISKGLLTDLKMGRRSGVSAATAQKIAAYFGVTVGYLLGEEDKNEKTPAAISDEDIKVALFGGDTDVSDEMWNEVMNYAEYLKQKYGKN